MSTKDDALFAWFESLVETDVQRALLDAVKQAFGRSNVEIDEAEAAPEPAAESPRKGRR